VALKLPRRGARALGKPRRSRGRPARGLDLEGARPRVHGRSHLELVKLASRRAQPTRAAAGAAAVCHRFEKLDNDPGTAEKPVVSLE